MARRAPQQVEARRRQAAERRRRRVEKHRTPRAAATPARAPGQTPAWLRDTATPPPPPPPPRAAWTDRQRELVALAGDIGLSLLPAKVGSKRPACRWKRYQSERMPAATLERLAAERDATNLLMVMGAVSGLVCIDIDDRALEPRVLELEPRLRQCLRQETGRGAHYFALHPGAGVRVKNAGRLELAPGVKIDLKADGGYVVAPWSTHKTERTYTPDVWPWSEQTLGELPVFDRSWFDGAVAKLFADERQEERERKLAQERVRRRLERVNAQRARDGLDPIDYGERYRAAQLHVAALSDQRVEEGGRDNFLYAAAEHLVVGLGITDDDAAELLVDLNHRVCSPPLDDDEVRKKPANARKSSKRTPLYAVIDDLPDSAANDEKARRHRKRTLPKDLSVDVWVRRKMRLALLERRAEIREARHCADCQAARAKARADDYWDTYCDAHQRVLKLIQRALSEASCCLTRLREVDANDDYVVDGVDFHAACERVTCGYCAHCRARAIARLLLERHSDMEYVVVRVDTPQNAAVGSPRVTKRIYRDLKRHVVRRDPAKRLLAAHFVATVHPVADEREIRMRARAVPGARVEVLSCQQLADLVVDGYTSWARVVAKKLRAGDVDAYLDTTIFLDDRLHVLRDASRCTREHPAFEDWPTMSEIREAVSVDGESAKRRRYEIMRVYDKQILGYTEATTAWRAILSARKLLDMHDAAEIARRRARNGPSEWYQQVTALERARLDLRKSKLRVAADALEALRKTHGNVAYKIVLGEDQLE